jgi:hypothetical protein
LGGEEKIASYVERKWKQQDYDEGICWLDSGVKCYFEMEFASFLPLWVMILNLNKCWYHADLNKC